MSKMILMVECCGGCSHWRYDSPWKLHSNKNEGYCEALVDGVGSMRKHGLIPYNGIPDWCPLEEAKKCKKN